MMFLLKHNYIFWSRSSPVFPPGGGTGWSCGVLAPATASELVRGSGTSVEQAEHSRSGFMLYYIHIIKWIWNLTIWYDLIGSSTSWTWQTMTKHDLQTRNHLRHHMTTYDIKRRTQDITGLCRRCLKVWLASSGIAPGAPAGRDEAGDCLSLPEGPQGDLQRLQ